MTTKQRATFITNILRLNGPKFLGDTFFQIFKCYNKA